MPWIKIQDQKPGPGEKVDAWFVDSDFPDGVRLADVSYEPVKLKNIWNKITHWRYPPAPPEGK